MIYIRAGYDVVEVSLAPLYGGLSDFRHLLGNRQCRIIRLSDGVRFACYLKRGVLCSRICLQPHSMGLDEDGLFESVDQVYQAISLAETLLAGELDRLQMAIYYRDRLLDVTTWQLFKLELTVDILGIADLANVIDCFAKGMVPVRRRYPSKVDNSFQAKYFGNRSREIKLYSHGDALRLEVTLGKQALRYMLAGKGRHVNRLDDSSWKLFDENARGLLSEALVYFRPTDRNLIEAYVDGRTRKSRRLADAYLDGHVFGMRKELDQGQRKLAKGLGLQGFGIPIVSGIPAELGIVVELLASSGVVCGSKVSEGGVSRGKRKRSKSGLYGKQVDWREFEQNIADFESPAKALSKAGNPKSARSVRRYAEAMNEEETPFGAALRRGLERRAQRVESMIIEALDQRLWDSGAESHGTSSIEAIE